MRTLARPTAVLAAALALTLVEGPRSAAGPPPWAGPPAGGTDFQRDRDMFHALLASRTDIRRTVTKLPDGVLTVTESVKPEIATLIQEHVTAMHRRLVEGRPIHARDPLFAAVFRNAGKIAMTVEKTKAGVRVKETSTDPAVARLIQAHAAVVSLFLRNGFSEMRVDHTVPDGAGN
jgi:hypothetical protein